jgi:hypothetical protein
MLTVVQNDSTVKARAQKFTEALESTEIAFAD